MKGAKRMLEEAMQGTGLEKVKYSKTYLEMENQLEWLVKGQKYEEASVVQKRLEKRRKKETQEFV